MNTKQIADKIVSALSDSLASADLPAVRSVFVSGSYCRGKHTFPFSTTMFDLKEHHIPLYGETLDSLLPPPPPPSECAADWLHFGEPTLHKYRILELYQKCIPEFPEKCFGEHIIRNYIGSFYPDRPPQDMPLAACKKFVDALAALV